MISVSNGKSSPKACPQDDVSNRVCFGTAVDKLDYINEVRMVSAVAMLREKLLMKECGKKRTKVLHPACEGKAPARVTSLRRNWRQKNGEDERASRS